MSLQDNPPNIVTWNSTPIPNLLDNPHDDGGLNCWDYAKKCTLCRPYVEVPLPRVLSQRKMQLMADLDKEWIQAGSVIDPVEKQKIFDHVRRFLAELPE